MVTFSNPVPVVTFHNHSLLHEEADAIIVQQVTRIAETLLVVATHIMFIFLYLCDQAVEDQIIIGESLPNLLIKVGWSTAAAAALTYDSFRQNTLNAHLHMTIWLNYIAI